MKNIKIKTLQISIFFLPVLFICNCYSSFSQNLIPNADFEVEFDAKNVKTFESYLPYWKRITMCGRPYLQYDCLSCGHDNQIFGKYIKPNSGKCFLYYYAINNCNTLFQAKLKSPLDIAKKYKFSCWIRILNKSIYSNSIISPAVFNVYLSEKTHDGIKYQLPNNSLVQHNSIDLNSPVLQIPAGINKNALNHWVYFEGVFTSKSNYPYLLLGNSEVYKENLFIILIDDVKLNEYKANKIDSIQSKMNLVNSNDNCIRIYNNKSTKNFASLQLPFRTIEKVYTNSDFCKKFYVKHLFDCPDTFYNCKAFNIRKDKFSYTFTTNSLNLFCIKLQKPLKQNKIYNFKTNFSININKGYFRRDIDHNIFKIYLSDKTLEYPNSFKDSLIIIKGDRFPEDYVSAEHNTQYFAKEDIDFIVFGTKGYKNDSLIKGKVWLNQIEIEEIEYKVDDLSNLHRNNKYIVNDILFDHNSTAISTNLALLEVKKIYYILSQNTNLNINIYGYTDNIGDKVYNLKLSGKRAESIKNRLIKEGINKNRIFTYGMGELDSNQDIQDISERAFNRRVEIEFYRK